MMLKDRGVMKWTSLMLPEHVTKLRDWSDEEHWEHIRELDEQKIEEINEALQVSLVASVPVKIKYYDEITHRFKICEGVVRRWDPIAQRVGIELKGESLFFLSVSLIQGIIQ